MRKTHHRSTSSGSRSMERQYYINSMFTRAHPASQEYRELKWLGHLLRMEDCKNSEPNLGNPKCRWRGNVQEDLRKLRISATHSQDHTKWNIEIEQAKALVLEE